MSAKKSLCAACGVGENQRQRMADRECARERERGSVKGGDCCNLQFCGIKHLFFE